MSTEPLCTKKVIQPCITSLLSPSADLVVPQAKTADSVEVPFDSVKHKKRKRSKRSSEQSDNKPIKRSMKKTPEKMLTDNSNEETMPLDKGNSEVDLSPELKELEKRLNTSMLINIKKSIDDALKPIKDSIEKIVSSSSLIDQQEIEIKRLSTENQSLKTQICELRDDVNAIQDKLNNLENKSLESNLIFRGIEEQFNETESTLRDMIYHHIADTFNYQALPDRMSAARSCAIRRCRRLGRPTPGRPRPISVEFENRCDADSILEFKYYLSSGIYVDQEYSTDTERKRRILRPILRAAKMKPELRFKSRMELDKLVIDGKRYGIGDLDKLPQSISPVSVSTKSNDDTVGFFGELCPFSNFYQVKFNHQGQNYHSSEQFIQYTKAKYCNDHETAERIINTRSALACKKLGYTVQNYNHQGWIDSLEALCTNGIRAKFEQNPPLLRALMNTGDKVIVESSKDDIWGTGVPLFRWDCLQEKLWMSRGKLGTILMEIRESHKAAHSTGSTET